MQKQQARPKREERIHRTTGISLPTATWEVLVGLVGLINYEYWVALAQYPCY